MFTRFTINIFIYFQDESHLPHISITWNRNTYAMEYDHNCQRGNYNNSRLRTLPSYSLHNYIYNARS